LARIPNETRLLKRFLIIGSTLALLIALVFSAGRIVGRVLDHELAGLLSSALGLPVDIERIHADLTSLDFSTHRLTVGDLNDPVVVATDVIVGLSWAHLLQGELRLVRAAADDLSLKPSGWPRQGDAVAASYQFLEPWLPQRIDLAKGRYVAADEQTWPISNAAWRRELSGGVSLHWTSARPGGDLRIEAELDSLSGLLDLAGIAGQLQLRPLGAGVDGIELAFTLAPETDKAYTLSVHGRLATTAIELSASSPESWTLPQQSLTRLGLLDPEPLQSLLAFIMGSGASSTLEAKLIAPVPQLDLPQHKGRIEIADISINGEALTDTGISFSSDSGSLQVDAAVSHGAGGVLRWSGSLRNVNQDLRAELQAKLTVSEDDAGLIAAHMDAEWFWQNGSASLTGQGASWGALVDDLQGAVTLAGFHRGETRTPLQLTAQLDRSPDALLLEPLQLQLGAATLSGRLELSGGRERRLRTTLRGGDLDLGFLFYEPGETVQPGIAMPTFLLRYPSIDLDWDIALQAIKVPIADLADTNVKVFRDADGGKLTAGLQGQTGGELDLLLSWDNRPAAPSQVSLEIQLRELNLDRSFGQEVYGLDSRTTGSLQFNSAGNGLEEILASMRGHADLAVKLLPDNGLIQSTKDDGKIALAGSASLILADSRIVGVNISGIKIASLAQDITGDVAMQANSKPWLIAALRSERLDLGQLVESLPASAAESGQQDLLALLREIGPSKISFDAGHVTYDGIVLTDLAMIIDAGLDSFLVNKLDFGFEGAEVSSRGQVHWLTDVATLDVSGEFNGLMLEDFLQPNPGQPDLPLQGEFTVSGQGVSLTDLYTDLEGQLKLESTAVNNRAVSERRLIEGTVTRRENGFDVDLKTFAWAGSDLKGRLNYTQGVPAQIDLQLVAGVLNLAPWENALEIQPAQEQQHSMLQDAARSATDTARAILAAPYRLLHPNTGGAVAPSAKVFSQEPFERSLFSRFNGQLHGSVGQVTSGAGAASDITVDASLRDGTLLLKSAAGEANGGQATLQVRYASALESPEASLLLRFSDVHKSAAKASYPQSGHFELSSHGASSAAMASNLDGLVYLELGQGPFDYGRVGVLTADVAGSLINALIPSAKARTPHLQCAITLGMFKDGIGITPYGYAARTRSANLLGKMEVDLGKEQIRASFRSLSREGMGISIGNAFSNTVSVQGPLSDPHIVPNTGSLLFRSWAAYMTAGMSMLGESMYNRVLASADPCIAIHSKIRENICTSDAPISGSPLVCPSSASDPGG
jgi:hypothetical protein